MSQRSFKLIYLSHDLTKKIEWSLTKYKVKMAVSVVVGLFVLLNLAVGFVVANVASTKENQALELENRRLREHVEQFDQRLAAATERMSNLAESDNMLRLMADLPVLEEEVRNVGIGGTATDPMLEPTIPEVNKVDWTLDKLDRELELQMESFKEIHNRLSLNADLLDHMPTLRPIDTGYMSSFFGMRGDPYTKKPARHYGIDFSAPRGTPIKATAAGKVVYAGQYYTYGKFVVIDHGRGYETAYGHLHKINVAEGQQISKGDILGLVGSTGRATASHLHYEVRINGVAVNPIDYVFDEVDRFPTMASGDLNHRR
jgi:murein DD-endopeptidase MepM/ murein hydrolase activator NlpD